jgi:hypothetical protein
MKQEVKIYGAGLAGLLAGCVFQNAQIIEAAPRHNISHKALLRFRSSAVGDAVGIPFRKVKVNKGIFISGQFAQPNILLANLYSKKVIGKLADRSIWNLEPVERFIAPEDFIEQLIERCDHRIQWETKVDAQDIQETPSNHKIISTMPMSVMTKIIDELDPSMKIDTPAFNFSNITVRRWRIKDADVFQTIYFPHPDTTLYRASMTKDMLIAEYIGEADPQVLYLFSAFGIDPFEAEEIGSVKQGFGKIAPIDDQWRKDFIYNLSNRYDIFSLGRFGTWRNILMDDVLNDLQVIKKLMNATTYERSRINSK